VSDGAPVTRSGSGDRPSARRARADSGDGLPAGPALDALLRVAAALPGGDEGALRAALEEARRRCSAQRIEEALLQAYLFLGFPAAINAFAVWREETAAEPGEGGEDPDLETRRREGEARCRLIYGRAYERLRARMRVLHPALDRWMIEEGYGKGLARPGLTVRERELCAVSLLAAGGFGPQLGAHARGALHAGASPAEVERAVEIGTEATRAHAERRPDPAAMRDVWKAIEERLNEEGLNDGCSSISSGSG